LGVLDSQLDQSDLPKTWELEWEKPFIKIIRKYGRQVVDAIYSSDEQVAADKALQGFKQEMDRLVHRGLPERYDFKTKEGIARFYSDSVYVVTVRHKVYGTQATFPGLDPSIMSGQVPLDYEPDAVDAYNSTVWVGLATAQAQFAKLEQDFKNSKVLDAIDDLDVRARVGIAFNNFQKDLSVLQEQDDYDYAHLRVLPVHLETGAGY